MPFYFALAPAPESWPPLPNQAAAGLAVQAKASLSKAYNGVPQLQMDRTVSTVLDVWFEWTEGRGGKPAILDLNQKYGSDWRQDDKNAYSRRKKLIDEVNYIATAQLRDPMEAAQLIENDRLAGNHHINYMWETWVKDRRKAREKEAASGA